MQRAILSRLVFVSPGNDLSLVDISTLFWDALTLNNVHADNVMLVESFGPTLWDSVLDLVLDHGLVGALGQCLSQRLFVQLVKFVVELSDHLLDVCAFLFGIESLNDGKFDLILSEHALLQH